MDGFFGMMFVEEGVVVEVACSMLFEGLLTVMQIHNTSAHLHLHEFHFLEKVRFDRAVLVLFRVAEVEVRVVGANHTAGSIKNVTSSLTRLGLRLRLSRAGLFRVLARTRHKNSGATT